jgi:hypothetical protein
MKSAVYARVSARSEGLLEYVSPVVLAAEFALDGGFCWCSWKAIRHPVPSRKPTCEADDEGREGVDASGG